MPKDSRYVPPQRRPGFQADNTPGDAEASSADHLGRDHLQTPNFSGVDWRPQGGRVEAHAPWTMTRLSLEEGVDDIVHDHGEVYRLNWSRRMMEEFGEKERARSFKDGSILFEFDAHSRVARVFHSGPGG